MKNLDQLTNQQIKGLRQLYGDFKLISLIEDINLKNDFHHVVQNGKATIWGDTFQIYIVEYYNIEGVTLEGLQRDNIPVPVYGKGPDNRRSGIITKNGKLFFETFYGGLNGDTPAYDKVRKVYLSQKYVVKLFEE